MINLPDLIAVVHTRLLIAVVQTRLDLTKALVGPYSPDSSREWHPRHRAAMETLADQLRGDVGARITHRWDGAAVTLAGIRSTSTSGLAGALQNWLRAARRKAGLE